MIEKLDTNYGTMFVPDNDQGQYWWLKNTGRSPENEFIELVCGILDGLPPGVAVDVGANFGCWSLPLAKHATRVMAFEPQWSVYNLLRSSIDANSLPIDLYCEAVGSRHDFIDIPDTDTTRESNFGCVEVGRPHPEHPEIPMIAVPLVMLDRKCRDKTVSFIKADVEGYETEVLKGALQTIHRCKPVMFVEANHPRTDSNALGNFIQSLGYNVEVQLDNFLCMPL